MDAQARKILGNIWALNAPGNRINPEDVGIDRAVGWDSNYEQIGTFKFPERRVTNQLLCEVSAAFNEGMTYGLCRWDVEVDWKQWDYVIHGGSIYVALQDTGPSDNTHEEPGTGSRWRQY